MPTTRVLVKEVTLHDDELYAQMEQSVHVTDDNRLNGKLLVVNDTFNPDADDIALMVVFAFIVAGFHSFTPTRRALTDEQQDPPGPD